MCSKSEVQEIVEEHTARLQKTVAEKATPKGMHNLLAVLSTVALMLMTWTLNTVLDNKSSLQIYETTVEKQFSGVQEKESDRHIVLTKIITSLSGEIKNIRQVNQLQGDMVNNRLNGLNNTIKQYHPNSGVP